MDIEIKFIAFWKDTKKEIKDYMAEYSLESLESDKLIIIQFRGLKDKNGVEIYDFDIYGHNNSLYVIIPSKNNGICSVQINKNLGTVLHDLTITNKHNRRNYNDIYRVQKYIEVIGNFFQNPELLKS